jgi:hypothetical protein
MIVEAEVRDAIPVPDALFRERGSEALASVAEFGIGELTIAGDDTDLLSEQVDRAMKTPDGCQGNEHDGIVSSAA